MTKLLKVCCILAVVCLFQHVEGKRNVCMRRCRARCRTLKNERQTPFWKCLKKCASMSRTCEFCLGPNKCFTCATGYQLSYSSICVDTDECATDNGRCPGYATCTNSVGSYQCSCNSGFTEDGKTCLTTPAPTTTATKATPPITSTDVVAGSTVTFHGRGTYTFNFVVTFNPAPTSVTMSFSGLAGGSFTAAPLSGGSPAGPANSYQYSYTFNVVDRLDEGLYTVTASNNVGSPATYQFNVRLNWKQITVNVPQSYDSEPLAASGLIAFQTNICMTLSITLAPNVVDTRAYGNGDYTMIFIDGVPAGTWSTTNTVPESGVLSGTDCTTTAAPTYYWIMIQVTQVGAGNSYNIGMWTSPEHQYIPSTDGSVTNVKVNPPYTISTVLFDTLNVGTSYVYYPGAV